VESRWAQRQRLLELDPHPETLRRQRPTGRARAQPPAVHEVPLRQYVFGMLEHALPENVRGLVVTRTRLYRGWSCRRTAERRERFLVCRVPLPKGFGILLEVAIIALALERIGVVVIGVVAGRPWVHKHRLADLAHWTRLTPGYD